MRAGSSQVNSATWLPVTSIGVVISITNSTGESKETTVGVDDFDESGISLIKTVSWVVEGEERTSWVETYNVSDHSVNSGTSSSRNVSSKTVTRQSEIVRCQTIVGNHLVDVFSKEETNVWNGISGSGVEFTGWSRPVNDEDIGISYGKDGVLDDAVDIAISTGGPSMGDEVVGAGWVVDLGVEEVVEVFATEEFSTGWVGGGEETESDVGDDGFGGSPLDLEVLDADVSVLGFVGEVL